MFARGVLTVGLAALLTFAAAATADAAQPQKRGKLALGKTSQGRGIAMRVQPRRLQMMDFNASLRCRDGSELIVEEGGFLPIATKRNGSFRDVQFGRTDRVWLRGRVTKKAVRGHLRVTDRWGAVKCNSSWFRFEARIRGG